MLSKLLLLLCLYMYICLHIVARQYLPRISNSLDDCPLSYSTCVCGNHLVFPQKLEANGDGLNQDSIYAG